jgi:hypothetical protein
LIAFPIANRVSDYWRVASYGYPCCFSEGEAANNAWTTLLTFFRFDRYDELKAHWNSSAAPWKLNHAAVESWKAAFEEFGLLYVISGSNRITITPAGHQLKQAADSKDESGFAWIGLNLLLRYPLRGVRRPKSDAHRNSDLLLYRCWYAALLDLDGYIWWTELQRILCRVFSTAEAAAAISDIKRLRSDPTLLTAVSLPVTVHKKEGFYNMLNQVAGHAGMNHLILGQDNAESPYGITEPKRRHCIRQEWLGMIRKALSDFGEADQCPTGGSAIARLPTAPTLVDETEYFAYLGAAVAPMSSLADSALTAIELQGERVFFLELHKHYRLEDKVTIVGSVAALCQLAKGQRIILSHDESWTYLVEIKALADASNVRMQVRKARPISNINAIRTLQGEH